MNYAAALPHLHEVRSLDTTDAACLADVRAVLARHGKDERFGVNLLHRHFAIGEDERLVEVIDEESRTLTARPMKADELPGAMPSAWQLTEDGPHAVFWCYDRLGPHA